MSKSRRIEAGHIAWRGLVGAAGSPDTRAGPGLVTLSLRGAARRGAALCFCAPAATLRTHQALTPLPCLAQWPRWMTGVEGNNRVWCPCLMPIPYITAKGRERRQGYS